MKLLDVMSAEYSKSLNMLYAALTCSFLIYLSALVVASWNRGDIPKALVIPAMLLQIAAFVFRSFSERFYGYGEEIRRMSMMSDGFGAKPEPAAIARISARTGAGKQADFLSPYFSSTEAPGARRLLENIEQSSFYTQDIACVTGKLILIPVFVGAVVGVVGLAALAMNVSSKGSVSTMVEAITLTLSFFVAGDFAAMCRKYFELSSGAKDNGVKCHELLKQRLIGDVEALQLLSEYNCTLASALPLLSFVYRMRRHTLERSWKTRKDTVAL